MKKTSLVIVLLCLLLFNCNNSKKESVYTSRSNTQKTDTIHPGEKLMKTYCYACHNATTSENERIAPPMIAIKRRYISNNTTKDEFINDLKSWIINPTEQNAKMFGAVKRFGVMQKLPYPDDVIEQIADYVYDNDIDKPAWFEEHYKQMGNGNRFK